MMEEYQDQSLRERYFKKSEKKFYRGSIRMVKSYEKSHWERSLA